MLHIFLENFLQKIVKMINACSRRKHYVLSWNCLSVVSNDALLNWKKLCVLIGKDNAFFVDWLALVTLGTAF